MQGPHHPLLDHSRDGLDPLPEGYPAGEGKPLVRVGDGSCDWVVIGADEIRAILNDTTRFALNDHRNGPAKHTGGANLLSLDPPHHTRIRRLETQDFTPRRAREMRPLVEEVVRYCLDDLEQAGPGADLMRRVSFPVTGLVTCAQIGVPRDDMPELARLITIRAWGPGMTETRAGDTYYNYIERLVRLRLRDPSGDGLLCKLIREHGHELTETEIIDMMNSLIFAQLEGTAQMLALGVLALLEHPDQLALLRADMSLLDQAVEELLRYVSVIPYLSARMAQEDVPMAGEVIRSGEIVALSVLGANRALISGTPDDLDITRERSQHLAFGHGIHFCPGAALARLELKVELEQLLPRFPELRLAVPREEIRVRETSPQFGIQAMPVAW
jgi:cytochrome P450